MFNEMPVVDLVTVAERIPTQFTTKVSDTCRVTVYDTSAN